MEFKKAIKRISALSVGASMVGATLFGAMAADLANYPSQYIKDGKFAGVLVVGDKAAAEDVIGVSDIAVSLQFAATKPAGATASTLSTSGEAPLIICMTITSKAAPAAEATPGRSRTLGPRRQGGCS